MITDLQAFAEDFANLEEHPAQKTVAEAYLERMEALKECTSFEELVSAYYPAIEELYQQVVASQKAYEEYILKAEQTRDYIEENASDFQGGPAFQKLESYLSDEITDPSENEFPNGSFAYIIDPENLLLDAEGLKAEMEFIDKLVNDALNEGLNPGADATSFIANADFSVVPNPNKGQMTLNFENLTGKIKVKVYDMRGVLIDDFETYNVMNSYAYTYQMKNRVDGIYFIVATGKEGTIAKKIIIKR